MTVRPLRSVFELPASLRAANRVALAVLVLLLAAGTEVVAADAPKTGTNAAAALKPRDPAAEVAEALESVRADGRRSVQELLEAYSRLSINQSPGVTALRIDLLRMTDQIHRERRVHFDLDEVEGLTLRNPSFWQAWFEFSPQDSSLLMLYASLLVDAGAMHRASTVLTLGVQALPLSANERMLWLTQQARTNWVLFKRLNDLEAREKTWRKREARVAGFELALRQWPSDAFALEELVRARANLPRANARVSRDADDLPVLTPAARLAVGSDLAALRRFAAPQALRFFEDTATARKFSRLWDDVLDEERPADDKQMAQLIDLLDTLHEPELRAILVRIGAARRGFYSPSDLTALEQICAERLTENEFRELSTALGGRPPAGLQLSAPAERPEELLSGMDARIHPVYAEHAVRECARETFWMQAVGDSTELRAVHQWQRSVRLANVGCFEASLADLEAAIAAEPKRAEWIVDRASLYSKLGRTAEAEAAFVEAQKLDPKNEHLRSTLAIFRFGQGRFADAERLYRAARRDDPNVAYSNIMACLAAARRGVPDTASLKKTLSSARKRWPHAILRHLAGEIDRQALLDAAQDDSELRASEQQCEAFFVLGQLALARGDTATAKLEFENSEAAGIVGFIEYGLAQLELQRLDPKREVRRTVPPAGEDGKVSPAGSTRI